MITILMVDPLQPATEAEERYATDARPIASVQSLVHPWRGDNGWGGEAAVKRPRSPLRDQSFQRSLAATRTGVGCTSSVPSPSWPQVLSPQQ